MAELLRGELRREAPEELPALHGRASRWYAEAGQWLPAIEHALLAHDWPRAAALLGDHWMTLYLEGAAQSVQVLFDRIPREHLVTDPQLAVTAAAARLLGGDAPAAAPYLAMAEETHVELDVSERRRFDVSLAVTRLLYARLTGQLQRAIEEAPAVLQPQDGRPWEHELASDDKLVVAQLNVGIAELWAGGRHASDVSLRRALHVARRRGHEYIEMQALGSLAGLTVMDGRLAESERLAGEAVELAERRGWSTSPAVATALLALIGAAYLRDRLDDATRLLERAEAAMRTTREPVLLLTLDYVHALVLVGRGDHEGAITRCREARASVAELHDEHFLARPNLWLEARQLIIVGARTRRASCSRPPGRRATRRRCARRRRCSCTARASPSGHSRCWRRSWMARVLQPSAPGDGRAPRRRGDPRRPGRRRRVDALHGGGAGARRAGGIPAPLPRPGRPRPARPAAAPDPPGHPRTVR